MKLRISKNSIRLRVTRSELDCLIAEHKLEETTRLGPGPDGLLTYELEIDHAGSATRVHYAQQRIAVVIGKDQFENWRRADQVGIYSSVAVGAGESLEVIVEKDFACIEASGAENADAFPNPRLGSVC